MPGVVRNSGLTPRSLVWVAVLSFVGCAGSRERAMRDELARRAGALEAAPRGLDGTLESQLAYAAARSPEVRAAYERFKGRVHRILPARRLPDPTVGVGIFVWNSGENAGVTAARAGIRQDVPFPTKLGADADAAVAAAQAMQASLEALVLDLRGRVAEAHYGLWFIRRLRDIESAQVEIVRALAESALGGLATGASSVADQQQIQLTLARLQDDLAALDEREAVAEAELRALLAAPAGTRLEASGPPPPRALPAEREEALREAVAAHPEIEALQLRGEAGDAMVRSQRAARLPSFSVGIEWMRMPGPMGTSGIAPNLGLRLPIYPRAAREAVRAAEAEASARRADRDLALHRAYAELEAALSAVRDSHRRAELAEGVLLPQAEAAFESVLGAYRASRSTVAAALLAQRDLLEVQVMLEQARAEHAAAWARLERVVGRRVARDEAPRRRGDE